jgi:outer membrane protein OmpA-like peptidoglycan-associated protein
MNYWKTIPFAAALLVLQAQAPVGQPASVPLYQVTIVQGSAKAINYHNMKHSTKIELKGTALAAAAKGTAKVKSEDGRFEITAKVEDLPLASTFGGEYLTYVLWGVSPEGRATNLGELVLNKHGKGKVTVTEPLQTFGLVVTAEPYFAVTHPSDVVVMENGVGEDARNQVELIDAKYELLKRGQYTLNLTGATIVMDAKTPFDVYQARNAVRIARAAGAGAYAGEGFGKAEGFLAQAENTNLSKKERIMNAREAIQRAEDSRTIAVQRQAVEREEMAQKVAKAQLDDAKAKADAATAAAAAAKAQAADATAVEQAALSQTRSAQTRTAIAESQTMAAESENAGLRTKLMNQLGAVLQTRATARGLILNMSGVLFQNGKAILQPAGREKLSKVAGILSTHKGLKIEADGFTDNTGTEAFNLRLSEQRAQAAKDYLVSQGVPAENLTVKGFGVENPIADNKTDAGRKENRRVELVVSGEGLAAANP